jgi:hypothetical protein
LVITRFDRKPATLLRGVPNTNESKQIIAVNDYAADLLILLRGVDCDLHQKPQVTPGDPVSF